MSEYVSFVSSNKYVNYFDTKDHFNNGFLRLLSMSHNNFEHWMSLISSEGQDIVSLLGDSFRKLNCITAPFINNAPIWFNYIAENPKYGIKLFEDEGVARLIRNDSLEIEENPPIYEEDYFEGDKSIAGGYGEYITQAPWRLEKATRQVKELSLITGLNIAKVLDIGSGYGYLRKALDNAGFNHFGIEVSQHAINVTKSIYGFDTYAGTISDYVRSNKEQFDIVTLCDVIEHIADPAYFLSEIYQVVKPGGFVMIKTPNIDCPEVDIFGPYYHSFKREHLIYFSAKGLTNYSINAGFCVHKATSISHLLKGFVKEAQVKEWENMLRGSDLVVYLRRL